MNTPFSNAATKALSSSSNESSNDMINELVNSTETPPTTNKHAQGNQDRDETKMPVNGYDHLMTGASTLQAIMNQAVQEISLQ